MKCTIASVEPLTHRRGCQRGRVDRSKRWMIFDEMFDGEKKEEKEKFRNLYCESPQSFGPLSEQLGHYPIRFRKSIFVNEAVFALLSLLSFLRRN